MPNSKRKRSFLAGSLALLTMAQCAACTSSAPGAAAETTAEDGTESDDVFVIYDGNTTAFALIESRKASPEEELLVNDFYTGTSRKIPLVNESRAEVPNEIIVGAAKREASAALAAEVDAMHTDDAFHYAARAVGDKILFYSDAVEGYAYLRDIFAKQFVQDGRIVIPKTLNILETVTWADYEKSPFRAAVLEKEAAAEARAQAKAEEAAALEAKQAAHAEEVLAKREKLRSARVFTNRMIVYDFDNAALEYEINYIGTMRSELSAEMNHTTDAAGRATAGKSVRLSGVSSSTSFRLLDAFTDADLGKTIEITAWVYNASESDTEISMSLAADTGKYKNTAFMTSFKTVPRKTWTPLTMTYTHLEQPVTNLSFSQPSDSIAAGTVYIDDVTLKLTDDPVYTVTAADTKQLPQTHGDRRLVWGDGFDSPNFDISKWFIDNRMNVDDMRREFNPETMKIEDGMLKLRSFKFTEDQPDGKEYETPHFPTTQDRMEFQYGYFEIRAKIPYYTGNSGAFWFRSSTHTEKQNSVEIDLVEQLGRDNGPVSTLHQWGTEHIGINTTRLPTAARSHTFPISGDDLSKEFHTYFMDWTPEYIAFGVDDDTYLKVDITENGISNFKSENIDMGVFHLPVYFILSEFLYTPAREMSYGLKGDEPAFGWQMEVDYVAVYQKDGEKLYVGEALSNR